jgi:multidrug efflux pump subunit AcrB
MWLIRTALRRPITILIAVIAVALCSILAISRMRIDIFPNLNLPIIYVAQPYGGMSPRQMEGYLVYYYEYHFLYINGIETVEDKSIQSNGLLKLTFHPGTDMSQALAQTISYVNRAHAFMPYGTVSPFVIRFDAGTVPVGDVVFSSPTMTVGEIQDLALNRVRPVFATLPGVSAPPPFGGNQRTIVITVNPDRLQSYHLTPDQVAKAISSGNQLTPAGNVRTGSLLRIVTSNSIVPNITRQLDDMPIRTGSGPSVYLRDIGSVTDSTDIPTGYALVNGRRAVYEPVTKRPDSSTLSVVNEVKKSLPFFRSLVPSGIQVSYEFDQSGYVKSSLLAVVREGLLGALLTGLVIFLFLRDARSSLIVLTTIPFALLTALVALWISGQTINIMTLGGLALAVGILVDEGVVAIENIDATLERETDVPLARAVLRAIQQTVGPRFLAMLAVVAVFVPSFFMAGVSQALFVPLSLAVAFSMIASFLLSSTLLPVMFLWMHKRRGADRSARPASHTGFDAFREKWKNGLRRAAGFRWLIVGAYAAVALLIILVLGPRMGQELFPRAANNQFRLRIEAPVGTRAEDTANLTTEALRQIEDAAGPGNVATTLGYVGTQAASYPINTVFLWTSGPHEAVINVALRPEAHIDVASFEEKLRRALPPKFPECSFSFEQGDIISQIMNFGAPTPVDVAAMGPDFGQLRAYVAKLQRQMSEIKGLRDLRIEQPLDYPSVNVDIHREMAGQLGVTAGQVATSLSQATSSSRFTVPNYWADPRTGVAYQVQVQYPQPQMTSLQDVKNIPVMPGDTEHPLLGDVAAVTNGTTVGEYDRENGRWKLDLVGNVAGQDLGSIGNSINTAIQRAGGLPKGANVSVRGQIAPMQETFTNLAIGLLLAVLVIFLLLAANFQSMRLSFVVFTTAPAAVCGMILMLLITHTTLNIESYMGGIMAIGVGTANAILLVTFAEEYRKQGASSLDAGVEGARERMRPIIMTSVAMIAGMVPMALAIGTGAEETAPLGRAVIGGLLAATFINLTVLPFVFSLVQQRAGTVSPSLDPDDPASRFAEQ